MNLDSYLVVATAMNWDDLSVGMMEIVSVVMLVPYLGVEKVVLLVETLVASMVALWDFEMVDKMVDKMVG